MESKTFSLKVSKDIKSSAPVYFYRFLEILGYVEKNKQNKEVHHETSIYEHPGDERTFSGLLLRREAQPVAVVPCADLTEVFATSVGDRVFFAFDKSDITEEARNTLARQAEFLKKNCNVKVTVVGHCDERGSTEYNYALGERRANAAKACLIANGNDASRITVLLSGQRKSHRRGTQRRGLAPKSCGHHRFGIASPGFRCPMTVAVVEDGSGM